MLFGENLQIDYNDFVNNVLRENIQIVEVNVKSQSIFIFLLGTFTLFIISRYGSDILDFLFQLGTDMIPRSISNTIQFAIQQGRVSLTREYLTQVVQEQLNDPNHVHIAVNVFRAVGHRI